MTKAGKGENGVNPNRGKAETDTDPNLQRLAYASAVIKECEALLLQARTNMQEAGAMNCKTRQWFTVAIASTTELRKHVEKLDEVKR
jgi:hypothetical protein